MFPWARLALLGLCGIDLRVSILALPPLLPAIHRDLGLPEAGIGALASLPTLMFAAAAIPGSLLVSRLGTRQTMMIGLAIAAVAGAFRGAADISVLFLATLLMGGGIAAIQPCFPALTRAWFPRQIALATAVYSGGLLLGEVISPVLSPALQQLLNGNWRANLAVWSAPLVLATVLMLRTDARGADAAGGPSAWWPHWRDPRVWALGLTLGGASAVYWLSNAFMPDYLVATHRTALVTPVLGILNSVQFVAAVLVAVAPRLVGHPWVFSLAGLVTAGSIGAFLLTSGGALVVSAGLVGLCAGLVLVLALALPPLLVPGHEVHRLTAGVLTVTYSCSFLSQIFGGVIWDASRVPWQAFSPALFGALLVFVIPIAAAGRLRPTAGNA